MIMKKFELDELIATFFGIGRHSKMPGTLGSVTALAVAFVFPPITWVEIVVVIIIGTWFSHKYSKRIGVKDPPEVVIDEVAGMWISIYEMPIGYALPALVLFRIVDICKPFPVNIAEKLPGGIGIMADDIVGGAMVWLILYAIKVYMMT